MTTPAPVLVAARQIGSPLAVAVTHVRALSAEDQVRWVAAPWIIAGVQHDLAGLGERCHAYGHLDTMVQTVGQSVCTPPAPAVSDPAVAVRFDVSREWPALVGAFDIDERPELVGSVAWHRHLCSVETSLTPGKGG